MNPDNPNPIFSFTPKPPVMEKKEPVNMPAFEQPLFQPQIRQEPAMQPAFQPTTVTPEINGNYNYGAQSNDAILSKLNELELLILQRQQPAASENHEEIINQLRAHTLQIAKLTKEVKLIEHQGSTAELKSEIDTLSTQLRSTNLYLSKIDRKIDYLMNAIGILQDKGSESDAHQELLQSTRTQALMLSKLERKINELLYHQTR
jgi:chromosome segregation ATPase